LMMSGSASQISLTVYLKTEAMAVRAGGGEMATIG